MRKTFCYIPVSWTEIKPSKQHPCLFLYELIYFLYVFVLRSKPLVISSCRRVFKYNVSFLRLNRG
ncbi:ORF281 [White spot syndrome virus]|uniref:ORF281 n=1 Tax=White spot syndrome virus TaxID=342409 RepID=A0A2D3I6U5_9VIRU|nr:ORF281 [White spot syndrome virus]